MPAPAYSFSPQFATIRSESPLAGMRPVVSAPEVRHTALTFQRIEPFKIRSEQPELVTAGIASAISEGAGGALKGITAAYVGEREKKEALAKETREHARAIELANIRSKGTPEEEEYQRKYRELSLQNIQSQIEQRGGDKKPTIPVRPAGQFPRVEPPLPTEPERTWSEPDPAIEGVNLSALKNVSPPIVQTTPIPGKPLRFPLGADFYDEKPMRFPLPDEGIARQQVPFGQLDYVPISEGEAEKLVAQPIPPSPVPQTAQQMGDFAEQMLIARQKKLEGITPKLDAAAKQEADARQQAQGMEPVLLPGEVAEPTGPDQFLGKYESFQDALYANEQLAKALPGYQTQEVVEGVDENGMPFYEVKAPVRKAPGTSATGVPEGMKIKSAKTDETGKTVVEYEPEVPKEKQIEVLKQPVQSNETMLKAIQQIKSIYKGVSPATGALGSIFQWIPASDAADVRQLIKVLKGNIAFKALSDMRKASPTGAAVGSVTERELDLLGNTMGAIDPAMSEFLFTENLNTIEKILTDYNNGVKQEIEALEKPQNFTPIQKSSQIKEGSTAINRQTGERIIFKNGQWIPAQ